MAQTTDSSKNLFADLGVPSIPKLEQNVLGTVRNLKDINRHEKIYILGMVVAILALFTLTIWRLAQISPTNPDFVFCIVLILNAGFCLFYSFDGVLRERASELVLLSVAILIITIYMVANYIAEKKTDLKLARMILGCVLSVPLVLYGLNLAYRYQIENRLIFRIVGANPLFQKLLKRLYCFQDVLKLDLELQLTLIALVFGWGPYVSLTDSIIVGLGIPLTGIMFFMGYVGFARESKVCAMLFLFLCLPGVGYIIFKMWDVSQQIDEYTGLAAATIVCGVTALLARLLVAGLAGLVYRGFGQGLREASPSSAISPPVVPVNEGNA